MRQDGHTGRAIEAAKAAVAALAARGVTALVTGSLTRGVFNAYSAIDLLVTSCPRHLKYAIEATVEDAVGGMSFDVIYPDELPPQKLAWFTVEAMDGARSLKETCCTGATSSLI